MNIKATILVEMRKIAEEQKKQLGPLTDDLILLDSGLDSLCFAILVARLEDALGIDPFTVADEERYPVTLRDLVEFYENAVARP
jgi:acyl carrier protein